MNCDAGIFIETVPQRKFLDIKSCRLPAKQRSAMVGLRSPLEIIICLRAVIRYLKTPMLFILESKAEES